MNHTDLVFAIDRQQGTDGNHNPDPRAEFCKLDHTHGRMVVTRDGLTLMCGSYPCKYAEQAILQDLPIEA